MRLNSKNYGSTPGPMPGGMHSVTQRKAVSAGYDVMDSKSVVKLHQRKTMTGSVMVPGLTNRGK